MSTPPFLLGATLIFWGWQTGLLWAGIIFGAVLEAPRVVKARWEVSDEDFSRIWIFCSVLFLGTAVYSFTASNGPSKFSAWLQHPASPAQSGDAGKASSETATFLFRGMPLIFFLFVAAQAYSTRPRISVAIISRIVRRWWTAPPQVNFAYPYFGICLYAAANHPGENSRYFWGLAALLTWALWVQRPRRFNAAIWCGMLAFAVALGFTGQKGIGRLQTYLTNLNPEWLSQFLHRGFDPNYSNTSLGKISSAKGSGRILIWLQTARGQAPNYLREASYRVFTNDVRWSVDKWQRNFEPLPATDGTNWILLPKKLNNSRISITCYLEARSQDGEPTGLLPLPSGCGRIEALPSYTILKTNGAGAVMATGPGLVIFDAEFGPGKTIDTPFSAAEPPPDSNSPPADIQPGEYLSPDLTVPAEEKPALAQIIADLGVRDRTRADKLQAVSGFFQNRFQYSTEFKNKRVKETGTNSTPVSRFLLKTRTGHCEYFATATVLLLRELGIPARYAVGYAVHEASGKGYVVRARDAHAWCLVWDDSRKVWQDFDTTPAGWVEEESKRASATQWLSDSWSWIALQFSKFRWGNTNLRPYLLASAVPILALLLYQIIFRRQKRRQDGRRSAAAVPATHPGLDSEFYRIEARMAANGFIRLLNEPLAAWLERAVKDSRLAEVWPSLKQVLKLHYQYRFDPRGLAAADREALRREALAALDILDRK